MVTASQEMNATLGYYPPAAGGAKSDSTIEGSRLECPFLALYAKVFTLESSDKAQQPRLDATLFNTKGESDFGPFSALLVE